MEEKISLVDINCHICGETYNGYRPRYGSKASYEKDFPKESPPKGCPKCHSPPKQLKQPERKKGLPSHLTQALISHLADFKIDDAVRCLFNVCKSESQVDEWEAFLTDFDFDLWRSIRLKQLENIVKTCSSQILHTESELKRLGPDYLPHPEEEYNEQIASAKNEREKTRNLLENPSADGEVKNIERYKSLQQKGILQKDLGTVVDKTKKFLYEEQKAYALS